MKVHALQTGTVRCKQFQLTGASNTLSRLYQLVFTERWSDWLPIYCWLIEHPDGLILVDTGETARIYEKNYLPAGGLYHKAVQTKIEGKEELPQQLDKLGFQTKDIPTVILTHLHGDHIGGLSHFEHANIYVSKVEYDFATSKKGPNNGYFPKNWPKWFQPQLVTFDNGKEGSFKNSEQLTADGKVIAVPTPGHSVGHLSVLVKNPTFTTIIAGDMSFNESTLKKGIPDYLLPNKEGKQSVATMQQYVRNTPSLFLSSHDWNAPAILKQEKIMS